jgi:hypothetical protein
VKRDVHFWTRLGAATRRGNEDIDFDARSAYGRCRFCDNSERGSL